jgi:sugar transferase (PEP-CTERM system associated)
VSSPAEVVATPRRREAFARFSLSLASRRWLSLVAFFEFIALAMSFAAAIEIRFYGEPEWIARQFPQLLGIALLFATVISVVFFAVGLYQPHSREGHRGQIVRMLVGIALAGVTLIILFYLAPGLHVGRGVLALALGLGLLSCSIVRFLSMALVDQNTMRRRVLVVGTGKRAKLLVDRMRRASDRRGFHLVGFVNFAGQEDLVEPMSRLEPGTDLLAIARRNEIDDIVVGVDERRGTLPMPELLSCRLAGIQVLDLATFFEREAGTIKTGIVDPSWLVFSDGFERRHWRQFTKRAFDLAASITLLALAAPIMFLTAIAILVESRFRGPIIYRQERVGEGGRTFTVLKFRSMVPDAEKDGVARWASRNDDRITFVGRIIRKLRIDELPQVFNVLCGDMSFVGPRPERPQFVSELSREIPYFGLRHCVKPGITGWAQLRYAYGASVEDAAEKLTFDLYYAKNHTLVFDLTILLQTVEVVLFGKGAR